jgi:hypothetical protein
LQHRRLILARVEHRIRVPQLSHNLLWRITLPSLRTHQKVSLPAAV